jgi:hypothetical protein
MGGAALTPSGVLGVCDGGVEHGGIFQPKWSRPDVHPVGKTLTMCLLLILWESEHPEQRVRGVFNALD